MKADLTTSVLAAIVGVVAAYLVCNLLLPPIETATFNTLDASADYKKLTEPNDDIFNFRALNPTVEVYVGACSEYNEYGECIDDIETSEIEEETGTEEEIIEVIVENEQETNPSGEN